MKKHVLSSDVEYHALAKEVGEYIHRGPILPNLAIFVKRGHVLRGNRGQKFELPMEAILFLFKCINIFLCCNHSERYSGISVILLEVCDFTFSLFCLLFLSSLLLLFVRLVSAYHHFFEHLFFVILRPPSNRQLGYEESCIIDALDFAANSVASTSFPSFGNDLPSPTVKVRVHLLWLFFVDHLPNV